MIRTKGDRFIDCDLCGASTHLGKVDGPRTTHDIRGRLVETHDSTDYDAHTAGYRRCALESWDPSEYGYTLSGWVCGSCYEPILAAVNKRRSK